MSFTTNKERRNPLDFDSLLTPSYLIIPNVFSTVLTASTIFLNSIGVKENASSSLPESSFNLKCFSIIRPPNTTDAIGTSIPNVWSDNPPITLNVSIICLIVFRFASSCLAGYALVHFNIAI